MFVEHGIVSSIVDEKAIITVPQREDYVTFPLTIPPHIKFRLLEPAVEDGSFYVEKYELTPGTPVAFVEFTDMSGVILAVIEE